MASPAPRWSSAPPDNQRRLPHKIVVPTDKPLRGIVTCEMFVGVFTHWDGNATVPCADGSCELCKRGESSRWYGFLGVWDPKTNGHIGVRVTSGSAEYLEDYIRQWKTLRAASISIERARKTQKAKMLIKLAPNKQYAPASVPESLDLHAILAHMWRIDKVTDPTQRAMLEESARRAVEESRQQLARLRDPNSAQQEPEPPPFDDEEDPVANGQHLPLQR